MNFLLAGTLTEARQVLPLAGLRANPKQDLLTYLVQGVGRHADSMGNREEFIAPGMQWLSAGSGIEHAEGGGTPQGEVS